MHARFRHLPPSVVAVAATAVLVASCGTTGASSSPPPPSDSPLPGLATPAARTVPPWTSPPPGPPDPTPPVESDLFAIDCRDDGPCTISYLPDPVADEPGWPVLVTGPCRGTAKGADGIAYAACDAPAGVLVHALTPDGSEAPGWPVQLPGETASVYDNRFTAGCGDTRSSLVITPDGSLVVAVARSGAAELHVLGGDGRTRAGWPQPFPGDPPAGDGGGGNGCRGFVLSPAGGIVAWGYEGVEPDVEMVADRTVFTAYGEDGAIRPGWPRSVAGAASRPLVGADGSIWFVVFQGQRPSPWGLHPGAAWRLEPDGDVSPGWPTHLGAVPHLSPDNRLIGLFSRSADQGVAVALSADGKVVAGWPASLGGPLETSCLFGDVPCRGEPDPAFGPDGTLFVALADGRIVAVDPAGRIVRGWPVALGPDRHATVLYVDAGGRLMVHAVECRGGPVETAPCAEVPALPLTLLFDMQGRLVETQEP
jgi:hypothetical protein